jgi:hypothetical protein
MVSIVVEPSTKASLDRSLRVCFLFRVRLTGVASLGIADAPLSPS